MKPFRVLTSHSPGSWHLYAETDTLAEAVRIAESELVGTGLRVAFVVASDFRDPSQISEELTEIRDEKLRLGASQDAIAS